MSFSQDIRSTGHFNEQFGRLRRRNNKSEVSKDDLETMQRHVNNMRTQIDWAQLTHITDNLSSNPLGPHDFIFEPDNLEVMIYNPFNKEFGDGLKLDKTLNSVAYDVIEIGDSTNILSPTSPTASTYHYEPYRIFEGYEYIEVLDSPVLDLVQFSVACWFRIGPTNTYTETFQYFVAKGENDGGGTIDMNYSLAVDDNNQIEGGFEEADGTDHFCFTAGTSYADGNWHLAVVTYDQVTVRLYIDGVEKVTHITSATPNTNAENLFIGKDSNHPYPLFVGALDEVRIWNNDLTAPEVLALYQSNTIPQTSAIVYQNTFDGSGLTSATKKCYYAVPDNTASWDWNVGFHPTQLKNVNSIPLNVGTNSKQFLYYDEFGTDLDFTANNLSFGFWIYPIDVSNSGTTRMVMVRRIDSSNYITLEIDTDAKLFGEYRVSATSSKRQYDTALTTNTWYYVSGTLSFAGPTLSLKVNDLADIASSKTRGLAPADSNLFFGSFAGASSARDFKGYLCFPHWYKHSTVLTTAERTSLYNYGTKTSTTEPCDWGYMQFG